MCGSSAGRSHSGSARGTCGSSANNVERGSRRPPPCCGRPGRRRCRFVGDAAPGSRKRPDLRRRVRAARPPATSPRSSPVPEFPAVTAATGSGADAPREEPRSSKYEASPGVAASVFSLAGPALAPTAVPPLAPGVTATVLVRERGRTGLRGPGRAPCGRLPVVGAGALLVAVLPAPPPPADRRCGPHRRRGERRGLRTPVEGSPAVPASGPMGTAMVWQRLSDSEPRARRAGSSPALP